MTGKQLLEFFLPEYSPKLFHVKFNENIEYKMFHNDHAFMTNLVYIITVIGKNQPNEPRIKKLIHCLSPHIFKIVNMLVINCCFELNQKWKKKNKGLEEKNHFWTACSTCRLLHQFERRYLGHKLVCPSCNKSFKAVEEVHNDGSLKEEVRVRGRSESERLELKDKVCVGVDENGSETLGSFVFRKKMGGVEKSSGVKGKVGGEKGGNFTRRSDEVGKRGLEKEVDGGRLWKRMRTVGEVLERSKPNRIKTGEEMMTLAEFQSEVKRKAQQKKVKMKEKEKDRTERRSKQGERIQGLKNNKGLEVGKMKILKKSVKLAIKTKHEASVKRKGLRLEKHRDSSGGESDIMVVVDSDFYDFDKEESV